MKSNIGIFAFISVGVMAASLLQSCKEKVEPTVAPPVRVTVMAVDEQSDTGGSIYSGTVQAGTSTTVSFSVAGTITDMYVDEGQKVAKGQVIARIKSSDYVNADNIAQAQLDEARDAYARLKKLHDANALPDIKWVEIQNKLKQAENAAEMSARTLNDATLTAPVSGVISRKMASKGQSVIPVEPVVEIVTMDRMTIDIPVAEAKIGSIREGQSANVSFKSLGLENLQGKVIRKSVVADPLTRSYTVKISLPASDSKILPGMVGEVTFPDLGQDQTEVKEILLPSQAVLLDSDNRNFVWIVKNGTAERRFVVADELVRTGVAVKEGLMPGDTVIVEGMRKVGTGTKVDVLLKR